MLSGIVPGKYVKTSFSMEYILLSIMLLMLANLKSGNFHPRRVNVSSRQCARHFPRDIDSGTGGGRGYPHGFEGFF